MTYKSKRILAQMATSLALLTGYFVFFVQSKLSMTDDLKSLSTTILTFIGICVVTHILLQIILHFSLAIGLAAKTKTGDKEAINQEIEASMAEDEMDRLIQLKSGSIGHLIVGLGFIVSLVRLSLGGSAQIALHVLLVFFFLGSIGEGVRSIYFYERGISHV